jgi:hypothetical protein
MDVLVLPGGLAIAAIGFFVGTIVILRWHRKRALRRRRCPIVAAIPATRYGIRLYCIEGGGAQCGFGGAFGTGPMALGIAALPTQRRTRLGCRIGDRRESGRDRRIC